MSTAQREIEINHGRQQIKITGATRKEVAFQLNDPSRWELVLKKFPELKLNIAHFGSNDTWSSISKVSDEKDPQHRKETIIRLMEEYEHVYSDFSYTITDETSTENFVRMLKASPILQKRSMFGSDYWVVYQEGSLQKNQSKFLRMVGDENLITKLCFENPYAYLFGKSI